MINDNIFSQKISLVISFMLKYCHWKFLFVPDQTSCETTQYCTMSIKGGFTKNLDIYLLLENNYPLQSFVKRKTLRKK